MPRRIRTALTRGAPWRYLAGIEHWYWLGVRLPDQDTKLAAEVAVRERAHHPPVGDIVPPVAIARALVARHPCRPLRRLYARSAGSEGRWEGLGAWVRAFPDIEPALRARLVAQAVDHNDPYRAFDAAMAWVTQLAGGDTAYRAAATAFVAAERWESARLAAGRAYQGHFLRHRLESHGEYAMHQGQLNRLLVELGATTLHGAVVALAPREETTSVGSDDLFVERFVTAVAGSHAMAGEAWDARDVGEWAERLRARAPTETVALARALGQARGDADEGERAARALGARLSASDHQRMRWRTTPWTAESFDRPEQIAEILRAVGA